MRQSIEANRGRPRNQDVHQAILKAALQLVSAHGFRDITVDQIAARAGVGKMSLYRRWPNKAAVVMDAFLELVGPRTDFPQGARALDSLQQQMRLQAQFFRSRYGRLIRSLLAEAQSDSELAQAFRDGWITPRRQGVMNVLQRAISEGDLRAAIDLETATDMLYAPLYYRLLLGTGKLDEAFIENVFRAFLNGYRAH